VALVERVIAEVEAKSLDVRHPIARRLTLGLRRRSADRSLCPEPCMPASRSIRRVTLLSLAAALAAGPSLGLGCGAGADPPSGESGDALRRSFPEQAARVLDRAEAFADAPSGFALKTDPSALLTTRAGLRIDLPKLGGDAVRLHAPAGSGTEMDVRVIEHGLAGEGALSGGAVGYPRAGGTSYWAASEGGFEEWLSLDAGIARAGQIVASWKVEGGTLAEEGGVVLVLDEQSLPRLRVTAPAAFAAGGRPVTPRLDVHGDTIDLLVDAGGEAVLVDPSWTATPNMNHARDFSTATLLQSGKVLVAGGPTGNGDPTAEVYDPVANTWTLTANSMANGRFQAAAALLQSGKVLVTGGSNGGVLAATSIYDPGTNTFSAGPNMTVGHFRHTATTLQNGKVLVAGGWNGPSIATAELFDPAAVPPSFTATTSMTVGREYHTATLLANGKVLVAGGDNNGATFFTSAELYNPAAAPPTWTATGSMAAGGRAQHAAVLLASSGNVLVAGGYNGAALATAELYNTVNGTWSGAGSMSAGRIYASAALFTPLGKVLAIGGNNTADLYDPVANSWAATSILPYSMANGAGTLTMLGNGTALAAGGSGGLGAALFSSANGTPCNNGSQCTSGFCADGFCCNTACGGLCQACSAAKTGGANGTCGNVTVATDPDNECALQSVLSCGTTGVCDGAGACQLYANGSVCVSAKCNAGSLINASTCDGMGTCVPGSTVSCGLYNCVNAACLQSCMTSQDCAQNASCQNGKCVALLPLGQPCNSGVQCSSTFCADGFCCNLACNAGACDACSIAAGSTVNGNCLPVFGNPCDDGDPCTTGDACTGMGFACAGTPLTCMPLDGCHDAGMCDAATGSCTYTMLADGMGCDDGDACTQSDTCQMGKCTAGSSMACPVSDPCHDAGTCDPKSGMCDNPQKMDGAACSDGDACSGNDTCKSGICTPGTPTDCAPMDMCHLAGTCDPKTGMCSNPAKSIDCTAKGPCENDGACDPKSGECLKSNKPDGTPCPSGTCIAGSCVADATSTSANGTGAGGGSASNGTGAGAGSTGVDSGSAGTQGAGTGSGGSGSSAGQSGGCGCSTPGTSASLSPGWLLLGLLLAARRRRDRASRP
jgi:MYXO-CTERM domain-containing protein